MPDVNGQWPPRSNQAATADSQFIPSRPKQKAVSTALRAGEELLKRRALTTMGLRFPGYGGPDSSHAYGHSLYSGAAGVGIALLDLAAATSDPGYLQLCDEVRDGLIEST